jgi:hypothetical protein
MGAMRSRPKNDNAPCSPLRALEHALEEQAGDRGEECAHVLLRLVDRELERQQKRGRILGDAESDGLHLAALRGFLLGLRSDLVECVGFDAEDVRQTARLVFELEPARSTDAPMPTHPAVEVSYDAYLARHAGAGADEEAVRLIGAELLDLAAAAVAPDAADPVLQKSRLLTQLLVCIVQRLEQIPEIGLACAHAALVEGRIEFEHGLAEAERRATEESLRVIRTATARARKP